MIFNDSLRYNEHLLYVIEKCNADKRAIRGMMQINKSEIKNNIIFFFYKKIIYR